MQSQNNWSLFPERRRSDDAIRMIIHGGPWKGREADVTSDAEPVPERGAFPGFVIEIAVNDLIKIDTTHLSRIDKVWLHAHSDHKLVRRLPEFLWQLPNLREFSLTDSRLNGQLFRRGVPNGVVSLRITGSGRFMPAGAPNPTVRYLDTLIREFHPRISTQMFPDLTGLTVHVGRKSDRKDRREMWDVIGAFELLTALHVEPADDELAWGDLPSGLKRLTLGNGDLDDLSRLHVFAELEFLHLRFLRSLKTLDGVETFSALRAVILIGMDQIRDYSALLRVPNLEYLQVRRSLCPDICTALEERGITVRG